MSVNKEKRKTNLDQRRDSNLIYEAATYCWAKRHTHICVFGMGVVLIVAERAKKYASCLWGRAAWPLVGVERCRFYIEVLNNGKYMEDILFHA